MHLGLESLLEFYRAHQNDAAMVLGTIVATEGSTYRKAGAMMLIAQDGSHRGLISGGCLESDLAQHAQQVFKTLEPQIVSYDLSAGDDLIWGLGIGCEGAIHLLLQPIEKSDGFGFLATLDNLLAERQDSWFSLVTRSSDQNIPMGSFALQSHSQLAGLPELARLLTNNPPNDNGRRFYQQSMQTGGGEIDLLQLEILPPPALLICGAGIDALPLARLAVELGWYCQIIDHRSGFADPSRFPSACVVQNLQPERLAEHIDLSELDAVVIMSHNLEHDRSYLQGLAGTDKTAFKGKYIGMLGPQSRRNRLIEEAGVKTGHTPFIHGPAGLDIGAELPESIALSIIAEIHAELNRRQGGQLSHAHSGQQSSLPDARLV